MNMLSTISFCTNCRRRGSARRRRSSGGAVPAVSGPACASACSPAPPGPPCRQAVATDHDHLWQGRQSDTILVRCAREGAAACTPWQQMFPRTGTTETTAQLGLLETVLVIAAEAAAAGGAAGATGRRHPDRQGCLGAFYCQRQQIFTDNKACMPICRGSSRRSCCGCHWKASS